MDLLYESYNNDDDDDDDSEWHKYQRKGEQPREN